MAGSRYRRCTLPQGKVYHRHRSGAPYSPPRSCSQTRRLRHRSCCACCPRTCLGRCSRSSSTSDTATSRHMSGTWGTREQRLRRRSYRSGFPRWLVLRRRPYLPRLVLRTLSRRGPPMIGKLRSQRNYRHSQSRPDNNLRRSRLPPTPSRWLARMAVVGMVNTSAPLRRIISTKPISGIEHGCARNL